MNTIRCLCFRPLTVAAALTLLCTLSSEPASAQPADGAPDRTLPQVLSLADAFRLALEANRDLVVARYAVEAADGQAEAAHGDFDPTLFAEGTHSRTRALSADDPPDTSDSDRQSVRGGVRKRFATGTDVEAAADVTRRDGGDDEDDGTLDDIYTPTAGVTVRQDLLDGFGIGVNRTGIRVAANDRKVSAETLRELVIETLYAVERVYWELYYSAADVGVRQAQLDRASKLVARAEAQVRVGEAAPIEVTRAKASAAGQEVSILDAKNRVRRLTHQLIRLLGACEPGAVEQHITLSDAPPVIDPDVDLPQALAKALEWRPELARMRLDIESAEWREQARRNERLPTLQVYGTVQTTGLDDQFGGSVDRLSEADGSYWEVGIVLEQPLGNRASRGRWRAARAQAAQARARYAAARENVIRSLADALHELETAEGRVERATESRQLAAELLEAEAKSFTLGRSDSLDVLNAQQSLAAAERDEVRARVDLAVAHADLLRLQGDLPDTRGITVTPPATGD